MIALLFCPKSKIPLDFLSHIQSFEESNNPTDVIECQCKRKLQSKTGLTLEAQVHF